VDKVTFDFRPLTAFVNNAPGDRYPRAMLLLFQLLRVLKLNSEDKQDLLLDLSDLLDGIQPSERSGIKVR